MIRDYLDFNIARFVKDCYEHKKALPALIEQYNQTDGVQGIDPSKEKVQTSPSRDSMDKIVALRLNLDEKIQDYQKDIKVLEKACQTLTEDEKEAIDICFNGKNISEQCYMHNIDERTVYRRRKRALAKLSAAIVGQ
jgi:DNA-directed RNA polymerase specialized sigma24 family protein